MQIRIRKIKLTNFKGIRTMEIAFNQTTNIFGENAAGKTTIFDAFVWCLFGKDSTDRKDFEVKTLDENNNVIPQIEHEVECELSVDSQVINIKRVLREKWVKRRGDVVSEFAGNETIFFWNDVPLKQNEFQQKISEIVDENLFKLVTNPLYFNTNLKWQDRRTVLLSLAEPVSNESILDSIATIQNKQQVMDITNMLNMDKSLIEYKKEIGAKKKKLKDELEFIPSRIDESQRSKPDTHDWSLIESHIAESNKAIADYNTKKEDIVKSSQEQNNEILKKQQELNNMKMNLQRLEHNLTSDRNKEVLDLQSKIRLANSDIEQFTANNQRLQDTIISHNNRIASLEEDTSKLRLQWSEINSRQLTISDDKTCCPACKQKLPDSDIAGITEKLTTNFNEQKAKDLEANNIKGSSNKSDIIWTKEKIEECQKSIELNTNALESRKSDIEGYHKRLEAIGDQSIEPTAEIIELRSSIANFEIPESKPQDFSELNAKIYDEQQKLDNAKSLLANRDQIVRIDLRIKELTEQEGKMAQELADLENTEFVIDAFNKSKINTMVENVNKKFTYVKFKLFETQINGGESECCEALVNGVPFSDANNASKVNAGLDVINALCSHHNVFAPIFIDNRESVNELIPTQSQIINLIVSQDKLLKVN